MTGSVSRRSKAVVLLSGGLDSSTVFASAGERRFELYALSFRYAQRYIEELARAEAVARTQRAAKHIAAQIDLRDFGGSALTGDIAVPKGRTASNMLHSIPVSYVPSRNTVFLSFAPARAETLGAPDIFIGVNALDYSGYPDCRPKYLAAYETMANLATKTGVEGARKLKIHAPLISLTTAQIIQEGLRLGVDHAQSSSCYEPGKLGKPCGACDSCLLRAKGFREASLNDPLDLRFDMA